MLKSFGAVPGLRTLLFLMPLVLANSGASGQSYMSLGNYIDLEKGAINKSQGSPVVTIYLGGVIEALGFANAVLNQGGARQLYCLPESGVSAEKLRFLVEGYITKTRGLVSETDFNHIRSVMNVGAVSLVALRETFPCP